MAPFYPYIPSARPCSTASFHNHTAPHPPAPTGTSSVPGCKCNVVVAPSSHDNGTHHHMHHHKNRGTHHHHNYRHRKQAYPDGPPAPLCACEPPILPDTDSNLQPGNYSLTPIHTPTPTPTLPLLQVHAATSTSLQPEGVAAEQMHQINMSKAGIGMAAVGLAAMLTGLGYFMWVKLGKKRKDASVV